MDYDSIDIERKLLQDLEKEYKEVKSDALKFSMPSDWLIYIW